MTGNDVASTAHLLQSIKGPTSDVEKTVHFGAQDISCNEVMESSSLVAVLFIGR